MTSNSEHGFAFLPEDGRPDRLLRFVDLGMHSAELNDGSIVILLSRYDEKKNILRINRQVYECMSVPEQERLARTHSPTTAYLHRKVGDAQLLRDFIDIDWPEAEIVIDG